MGMLTAAGVFAPAALAEGDAPSTDTPAGTTPTSGTAESSTPPEVVTPAPTAAGTTDLPAAASEESTPPSAWFGWGKLDIDVDALAGSVPDGTNVALTGAQVTLDFDQLAGAVSELSTTCTFDDAGRCVFPGDAPEIDLLGDGQVVLPPDSVFTLTLVAAPTSGQLLAGTVLEAYTTNELGAGETASITMTAPGAYRTLGVAVSGTGSLAGSTFSLGGGGAAVTATTGADGRATFAGLYLPGSYTVTQTSARGGLPFDATPRTLTVAAAHTLAERDTPVLLPVWAPAQTPVTPAPSTAPTTPTATVTTESVPVGAKQTVTLVGFQPFEMVHGVLYSTPVDLGVVQADASGSATFTFAIPAGFETGTHTITMTGVTSGATASDTFTVTASTTGAGLAYTGTDVVPLLALGATLVAGGSAAVVLGRRRQVS